MQYGVIFSRYSTHAALVFLFSCIAFSAYCVFNISVFVVNKDEL